MLPLAGLLTKAVLHLTAETVQLFARARQQAVEALAVLFVNAAVAVLKNSVGEVLKLFAEALLAVDHLPDFVFRMQLGGFKAGSDFAEIGLQRGVDISRRLRSSLLSSSHSLASGYSSASCCFCSHLIQRLSLRALPAGRPSAVQC